MSAFIVTVHEYENSEDRGPAKWKSKGSDHYMVEADDAIAAELIVQKHIKNNQWCRQETRGADPLLEWAEDIEVEFGADYTDHILETIVTL